MKFKINYSQLWITLIFCTPLVYFIPGGFLLGNLIAFFVNILFFFTTRRFVVVLKDLFFIVLSFFIILYNLFFTDNDISSLLPFVFFVIYIVMFRINVDYFNKYNYTNFNFLFYISSFVYFVSFIFYLFYLFNKNYEVRFSGFSQSATTFSIVLLLFFSFIFVKHKVKLCVFTFFTFYYIYISDTRTTLLLFFMIGSLYFIHVRFKNKIYVKKYLYYFYIILTLFLYPLYNILSSTNIKMSKREDVANGEKESSSLTRLYFTSVMLEDVYKSSIKEFLLGKGVNHSVGLITEVSNEKYKVEPHNDFLLLINDFGVLYTIAFFLYVVGSLNISFIANLVVLIYLSSFYHNMVFNLFCVSCVLFFQNVKEIRPLDRVIIDFNTPIFSCFKFKFL